MQPKIKSDNMKKALFYLLVLVVATACSPKTDLQSPDGSLSLSFALDADGSPRYSLCRDGQELIASSALGLVCQEADLSRDFELIKTTHGRTNEVWETVWGEEDRIRDEHREMVVSLKHKEGVEMQIAFRLFNDGLGFRYIFPTQDAAQLTVVDDKSEYAFVENHEAWSIGWKTEYYEGLWRKAPLSEKDTMCSPITIEMKDGSYAFLHEAAIYDYPAQNLYTDGATVKTYLTPWRDKENKVMDVKAYVATPFATPWHMLIVTRTLPEMVASRVMLNLNEPCKIEDTSWIKPMKFMGIWWGMHLKTMTWHQGPLHGATTENMEKYLRFAKEHHIEAVLAEGWNKGWEDWSRFYMDQPYDDWDMEYLSRLADSLGVAIVGHNETGGNAALYEQELEQAYAYHEKYGIHAIKTGYVSPIIRTIDGFQYNKGQAGVRHYRKVIETAAKYHIMIDNHEPVMPSGIQRTYPNLMTQEGVRGQEWNAWSRDGGSPCEHVTVLPFTRVMAGPVDYTPGVFHFENPVIPGTRVHSTLMNQLGLFVCIYSPLQMACDLPESYMEHPDAFRFIEEVPCDWQKSVLLDGKIGDYCVFARQDRNSDNWYVGGITDEEAREVELSLDFLGDRSYTMTLYRDAADAQWQTNPYAYNIEEREVKKGDKVKVWMAEGGGFAMSIR